MTPARTRREARLLALHREAAILEADGKCVAHLEREVAALNAENDPLAFPANDDGEDRTA